jgi:hypothetical protein
VKKRVFVTLLVAIITTIQVSVSAEWVSVDFTGQGITNEQLAEMVANGDIPQNVTVLYLGGNQISDATPLSTLISLRRLSLNRNQISDTSHLAAFVNLEKLVLSNNQITDIAPLKSLIHLGGSFGGLDLKNNLITDLSPLSTLTNLEWLVIEDNPISDLTPLESLTNLNVNWMSFEGTNLTAEQIAEFKAAIRANRDRPRFSFVAVYVQANPDFAVDVAIEILRYVVGLPPGEHFGVLQVDLGYEPRVDDAIEVLKWVVGLESVLDG